MFPFKIDDAQLKVFSAVCSNLIAVWLVAIFAARDVIVLTGSVMATGLAWYAAVWAERRAEAL